MSYRFLITSLSYCACSVHMHKTLCGNLKPVTGVWFWDVWAVSQWGRNTKQ